MAKPKAKRKVAKKCSCEYNKQLHTLFDEAFEHSLGDSDQFNEYKEALAHSDKFRDMCSFAEEEEADPEYMLCDAVRLGVEMGKRITEIKNLEKMLGY